MTFSGIYDNLFGFPLKHSLTLHYCFVIGKASKFGGHFQNIYISQSRTTFASHRAVVQVDSDTYDSKSVSVETIKFGEVTSRTFGKLPSYRGL